jgi:hypothetical protein
MTLNHTFDEAADPLGRGVDCRLDPWMETAAGARCRAGLGQHRHRPRSTCRPHPPWRGGAAAAGTCLPDPGRHAGPSARAQRCRDLQRGALGGLPSQRQRARHRRRVVRCLAAVGGRGPAAGDRGVARPRSACLTSSTNGLSCFRPAAMASSYRRQCGRDALPTGQGLQLPGPPAGPDHGRVLSPLRPDWH